MEAPEVECPAKSISRRLVAFDQVVGQKRAVEALRLAVADSKNTGRMPEPVLLLGASGLGKTTLALAFAHELGARLKVIDSATLDSPLTLLGHLMDVKDGDILFFDEIHALSGKLAEALYQAVEYGVIDLAFADGVQTKCVRLTLPKIAFVGATTNPERMAGPLLNRFPTHQELEPYSAGELEEIARRAAARDGIDLSPEAAAVIGKASAGIAREAISVYKRTRTVIGAKGACHATADDARTALRSAGIDETGLGPVQRRILAILEKHARPLAVRRLANWAGITVEAFRSLYEPALMQSGKIIGTPRGLILG